MIIKTGRYSRPVVKSGTSFSILGNLDRQLMPSLPNRPRTLCDLERGDGMRRLRRPGPVLISGEHSLLTQEGTEAEAALNVNGQRQRERKSLNGASAQEDFRRKAREGVWTPKQQV